MRNVSAWCGVLLVALGGGCGCGSSSSSGSAAEGQETAASGGATIGAAAPEIMLQNQDGRVRTLSEHRGHPVVVYFYPRDATPGCTVEACAFRDAWERLQATGAVVYGISTDDVQSHATFRTEHNLPFDLLADVEQTAANAYGVPTTMGFVARVTFLVDGDGVVRQVWRDVDPGVHADEVIAAIQALSPAAAPTP